MHPSITLYNDSHEGPGKIICDRLSSVISEELRDAESKIWHAHPVWFLAENPIVGYSK